MTISRRQSITGAIASGLASGLLDPFSPAGFRRSMAAPAIPATTPRLAMAEYTPYRQDSTAAIEKRFDLYRQLGFGTLRTNIAWRHLEAASGTWQIPGYLQTYIDRAVRAGFRLKLSLETLGGPPAWFLDEFPDSRIVDARGDYSRSDLSLWYPGLQSLLADKTARLFDFAAQLGVFPASDTIFVDLGPASEPIYPAAWTLGKKSCQGSTPWFYDAHAHAAFAAAMRGRYGSLQRANAAWGTGFANWNAVHPPRPGQHPGALWEDALGWYRDSKRDFVRWQIANYRRALVAHTQGTRRPRLIVFISGHHIEPDEWQQAASTAMPDCSLAIMSDSEYLMDLAEETGCWLQYPAIENADEADYLRRYMVSNGIRVPIFGENVGVNAVASRPGHLADVVLAENFYGLDYVRSNFLFQPDGVTPNELSTELGRATRRLRNAWAT
jgi:hypothetical protein